MTGKVEFGNEVRDSEAFYVEIGVMLESPLEVVNGPLASDIVRDDDVRDNNVLQHRRHDVIRVDIAVW